MSHHTLKTITAYLHQHIPLTAHMGVCVTAYNGTSVRLFAPLEANLNHQNTAFGGSLSTLGIMAGWTLLHIRLQEATISNRLVIQKSTMEFLKPATGDLEAVCSQANAEEWARFTQMITEKEKSRITLTAEIFSQNQRVAINEGVFVSLRL